MAQVPAWVDNNPANAPCLPPCGCCGCGPYGCGAGACGGCGYGGCGYGQPGLAPLGRRHGGCVGNWLRTCKLACLARRCGRLGLSDCCGECCDDCCTGGCADGCSKGCSDCDSHGLGGTYSGGSQSDENVIYDGPAPGSVIREGAGSVPSGSDYPRETRAPARLPYQLVSGAQPVGAGSAAFKRGLAAYQSHRLAEALGQFELAVGEAPDSALYHYYLALSLYELHGADAASDVLQQAVELERRQQIDDWGVRMERVQGHSRQWVEKARRSAGLVR